MALRVQNGKALLRNGRPSCVCCDDDVTFNFSFNSPGLCFCSNPDIGCHSEAIPSPVQNLLVPAEEIDWDVPTTANQVYANQQFLFLLQGPTFPGGNWRALVTGQPRLFTLSGSIGGDIVFIGLRDFWAEYAPQPPDPAAPSFAEVPQQGLFACDKCEQPRNTYCNITASFIMYPNVAYYLQFISYFFVKKKINDVAVEEYGGSCVPFFNGNIRIGSIVAP